ncbi:unnamed protein product, partial [marine sediment metagenome]
MKYDRAIPIGDVRTEPIEEVSPQDDAVCARLENVKDMRKLDVSDAESQSELAGGRREAATRRFEAGVITSLEKLIKHVLFQCFLEKR